MERSVAKVELAQSAFLKFHLLRWTPLMIGMLEADMNN